MTSAGPRIALLGATGHIGKGLVSELAAQWPLDLYVRDLVKLQHFLDAARIPLRRIRCFPVDRFDESQAEVAVNCTGVGDPARVRDLGRGIFSLTERFDNMLLDWQEVDPRRLYINMSSGAVYGTEFSHPAAEDSLCALPVNALTPERHYGIAKLHAEAKHRARPDRHIVDLRVFSFFSRFIELRGRFLLADVMMALRDGTELLTRPDEMTRDHVIPTDLSALVVCVIRRWQADEAPVNTALDVHSRAPVGKFALLDRLAAELGLRYRIDGTLDNLAPTGSKSEYFSRRRVSPEWGFAPRYDSVDGVLKEAKSFLAEVQ
ncbi:hypothetical protein JCM17960_11450 [Magnetospira thiophila]